ncbi:succinate dehydrogenase/fumarate reductase iron-sulfur subunit [Reinekea sp. G2M2-21]|uniref:succinate dehydrogenase/fumarate reductase iron-sulfur subunit n=1 Tax=Reinekea sp. G2M2-21 TaxID=2788942 RepID=UPI0018AB4796|nr:succinate dehydrogenase/fumarate reductase iron-sulfur subunit [Reinekea sp. G2M2-21]
MNTQLLVNVSVMRYRPEQDDEPWLQHFDVPFRNDMSILDTLHYIKDECDSTLAYRWSCRMAICGSCGFMINGEPKLGCKTFLRDYLSANGGDNSVRIEPLAHFPIERDLIARIDDFVEKLEAIKPYIIRDQEDTALTSVYPQTPQQMAKYHDLSMCINCGLCYAACPQYGLNNAFFGPAALALLQRYNKDNRDQGRAQRMPMLNAEQGVWACTFVGECSEVCPKGVDPARAINTSKLESTVDYGVNLIHWLRKDDAGQEGGR